MLVVAILIACRCQVLVGCPSVTQRAASVAAVKPRVYQKTFNLVLTEFFWLYGANFASQQLRAIAIKLTV